MYIYDTISTGKLWLKLHLIQNINKRASVVTIQIVHVVLYPPFHGFPPTTLPLYLRIYVVLSRPANQFNYQH